MKFLFTIFYAFCLSFSFSQLTCIKNAEGKIGFVNPKNDTIFKCEFDWVQSQVFGFKSKSSCIVKTGNLFGLISSDGHFIHPVSFSDMYVSSGVLALIGFAKDGKHGLMDRDFGVIKLQPTYNDRIVFNESYSIAPVKIDNKIGIINGKLEILVPIENDQFFPENLGLICMKKDSKFGFYDLKGKLIIPFVNDDIGLAQEKVKRIQVKRNGSWGIIDFSGKNIVPFIYSRIEDYRNGLALVVKNENYQFIDVNGKLKFPLNFDYAESFFKQVTFVGKYDADSIMKYALMDIKGNLLTSYKYLEYEDNFYEPYSVVQVGEKYGILNDKGVEIVPIKYGRDEIDAEYYVGDYIYIFVKSKNELQLFDNKGKPLLKNQYDSVMSVDHDVQPGLIEVYKNGLAGYFNVLNGIEIIPCQFLKIEQYRFEDYNLSYVQGPKGFGVWSLKEGRLIVPTEFDEVHEDENNYRSKILTFQVYKNDLQGVWSVHLNKLIVPIQYQTVYPFEEIWTENGACHIANIDGKWTLFSALGKVVYKENMSSEPQILTTKTMTYFIILEEESRKYGLYDRDGNEILPCIYDEIIGIKNKEVSVVQNDVTKTVKIK